MLVRKLKGRICSLPGRARVVQGLPDVATIMEDKVTLSNCLYNWPLHRYRRITDGEKTTCFPFLYVPRSFSELL